MAEDGINKMVLTIVSAVVGVIMLTSFAIPTIFDQVASITDAEALEQYGDMIRMVVLFLIIGLILFIVRSYNNAGR